MARDSSLPVLNQYTSRTDRILQPTTNSEASATCFQSSESSFLEFAALQRGRCAFSCIRPTPQCTGHPHPTLVLANLGVFGADHHRLLLNELEARLGSAL